MNLRLILFLSVLLLGILIAAELLLWNPEPPMGDISHNESSTTLDRVALSITDHPPPSFHLPSLRLYREVTERPLFSKNRRMKSADQPNAVPATIPSHLELQAVLITPQASIAVIFDKKKQQVFHLHQNEKIHEWRIFKIHPDRLVLTHGQQVVTLPLYSPREE